MAEVQSEAAKWRRLLLPPGVLIALAGLTDHLVTSPFHGGGTVGVVNIVLVDDHDAPFIAIEPPP